MTLDTALFLMGSVAEIAALILLFYKSIYRTFPVFTSYLAYSLLSDTLGLFITRRYPTHNYRIYLVLTIVDLTFQLAVLIELSMAVLKPVRGSLPRGIIIAVCVIFLLLGLAIWPFAKIPGLEGQFADFRVITHLQFTVGVLRILLFLALAACSQLLSIGWRDRELQIATGLGLFSLVSLMVSLIHTTQPLVTKAQVDQYHLLDVGVAASYVCSLVYWAVSFAQKVPERREFTPQMQNFLLAMAGTAKSGRVALMDSSERHKDR